VVPIYWPISNSFVEIMHSIMVSNWIQMSNEFWLNWSTYNVSRKQQIATWIGADKYIRCYNYQSNIDIDHPVYLHPRFLLQCIHNYRWYHWNTKYDNILDNLLNPGVAIAIRLAVTWMIADRAAIWLWPSLLPFSSTTIIPSCSSLNTKWYRWLFGCHRLWSHHWNIDGICDGNSCPWYKSTN